LLHLTDFARAVALRAARRRGAGFRAVAVADVTGFQPLELDFAVDAEDRVLK
jgi:hypothetical protein